MAIKIKGLNREVPRDFLSWFAGFWEGEGCLVIYRDGSRKMAHLQVTQTDRRPIELIKEQFQCGCVRTREQTNPKWNTCYDWTLRSIPKIIAILKAVLPFLKFRQHEVQQKLRRLYRIDASSKEPSWTEDEVHFLKENYHKINASEIAKHLRRHTLNGVYRKAYRLGLSNRKIARGKVALSECRSNVRLIEVKRHET